MSRDDMRLREVDWSLESTTRIKEPTRITFASLYYRLDAPNRYIMDLHQFLAHNLPSVVTTRGS